MQDEGSTLNQGGNLACISDAESWIWHATCKVERCIPDAGEEGNFPEPAGLIDDSEKHDAAVKG